MPNYIDKKKPPELHCSIAPLCMEIGQPVALIQTKVSLTEVKSCHTFMQEFIREG